MVVELISSATFMSFFFYLQKFVLVDEESGGEARGQCWRERQEEVEYETHNAPEHSTSGEAAGSPEGSRVAVG